MGCIAGKPKTNAEEKVELETPVAAPAKVVTERRESQLPWNRNSTHIYCGDLKGKPPDQGQTSPTTDAENAEVFIVCEENTHKSVVAEPSVPLSDQLDEDTVLADLTSKSSFTKFDNGDIRSSSSVDEYCDSIKKSNQSIGTILSTTSESSDDISSAVMLYIPSVIPTVTPKAKATVIKRPRSLGAVDMRKPRLRPLSYSPGYFKTKHPKGLFSINEGNWDCINERPIYERPISVDFSARFEAKGFDIHTQKLRKLLTHKSSKKPQPQPNHVKCLEEGPSRCFQPSQMLSRKKKNRDIKLIEVHYLRRAVGRPRLKFSKSIDIFVQRNENYLEYDPFLDPLAAQPGNPWYTEDETIYWEINRNMVDIPTVMRIRKWGLSFADLLKDETGRSEFEQFLKKEYSQENIRFYKACKELLICPLSKVNTLKASIESEFLTPGAPCEVNVDCKTMESVTQQLQTQKNVHRHIFQPAMDHVYALMKKDSYTRFIRSDQYNSLLAISQGHYTKKRFFSFGSNKRRIPSPQPKRRGSSSSGDATGGEDSIGGHSYHSYSTGNLREFDEKPKRSFRQSNSPSMRRRAEDADRLQSLKDDRRRSNLEVPQSSGFSTSTTEANRKSENMNTCLAISVPRNVIAPWEGNS